MKAAAAASLTRDELPAVMFHVIWDVTTASPPDGNPNPNLAELAGVSHALVAKAIAGVQSGAIARDPSPRPEIDGDRRRPPRP